MQVPFAIAVFLLAIWAKPSLAADSAVFPLADGFDFPVGPPDAEGYYKYRGFRPNGHLGDDWNGKGGGNSDLGHPVYSIGEGLVVFARDVRQGWGNVVIIRHAYYENGKVRAADSLYGHLDSVYVREGNRVRRGTKIGTIGNNRGMYAAHLHFEIRKNLQIGINRSGFSRGFENYHDPTKFITAKRQLEKGGRRVRIPINTFDLQKRYAPPAKGRHPEKR